MDKKEIRHRVREEKKLLSDCDKINAELNILNQLIENDKIKNCTNIVAYWSMPDEVPTQQIIKSFLQSKKIYLPVICGETLEFRLFDSESNLQAESKYGILEPTTKETLNSDGTDTVIIVPGIAFTKFGERLGRGGGYYDRILSKIPKAYKIGIAFSCQKFDKLPTEPHDILMDKVIFG